MMTQYDCADDVMEHKRRVEYWMRDFAGRLRDRAKIHDASKLQDPEKQCFDEWTPKLKEFVFGSDAYKAALAGMGEGLQHHYANNSHHPEHYPNGIDGMTLCDLVEMYCDWIAAADARDTHVDMAHLQERFNISPQLVAIFLNTLRDDDYWNRVNGVPCVDFAPGQFP